jgi:DNA-binding PadR family transcriptional regulator
MHDHRNFKFYGFRIPRADRFFNRGDFKYLILELLREKPRYGYEIMKDLEDRFHGFYSPSPGSVYPTLQWLEEAGYVTSAPQDGKKVYTITEEGKKYLAEKADDRESFKEQEKQWWGHWSPERSDEFQDIWHDWGEMGRLFGHKFRRADVSKLKQIREVIAKARREIEEILKS